MSTAWILLLTGFVALAQDEKTRSYEALLDKAKRTDAKVNFQALRLSYAETPMYNPYDPSRDAQTAILKALREKQYQACLDHVDKALAKNYLDINVHFAAYRCHAELRNQDKAKHHKYMLDGLIKSILASGDGKAPATAYVVISTEEEYAILDAVGLRRVSQALVKENGHAYDLLVARDDRMQKDYRVYFNIDRQSEWLRKSLEKDKK